MQNGPNGVISMTGNFTHRFSSNFALFSHVKTLYVAISRSTSLEMAILHFHAFSLYSGLSLYM